MKINIREYRDSDATACRALWEELAQHHADIYEDPSIAGDDPARGFEPYMANAQRAGYWVAEVEDRVVGCVGLISYGEEAEIEPVIVASDHRGRGIGSALIGYIIEEAKKRGIRFLSIKPVARNQAAISLFTVLGFQTVGRLELFQDLSPASERKWNPGITIHGIKLNY